MLAGRLLNIYLFIWTVTPQASCPAIRLSSCPLVRLSQTTQSPLDLSTFTYHAHTHTHALFFSLCILSVRLLWPIRRSNKLPG